MRNNLCKFSIAIMLLFLNIVHSKAQTVLSQDPIYQLVFQDEFDSLGLRTSNWNPIWPWGPNITNSNTANYWCGTMDVGYNYMPLNNNTNRQYDTTGTGHHTLISKHESTSIQGDIWLYSGGAYTGTQAVPFNFTTAMLMGRYNFKFAYVEMRFRTSNFAASPFNAYAPNLWMWGGDSATAYSEIDISEMGGRDWTTAPCSHYRHFPNTNSSGTPIAPPAGYSADDTAFWHGNSFSPNYYNPSLRRHSGTFAPGQWHTIGCEWTPEFIDTYYYSLSADTFQRFPVSKYPVDKLAAMPIVIDNYMPAPRDSFCIFYNSSFTQNTFNYDIDYIKVWQVRQNCTSTSYLNIASAGVYNNSLYQDLTIGGSSSTGCNFTSGNSHLAGNDFVLLQEGFEASGSTTTVLINTMKCQTGQTITYNSTTNPGPPPNFQQKRDIKSRQKK